MDTRARARAQPSLRLVVGASRVAKTPLSGLPFRRVVPRKTPFGRLLDHFHTHPRGRLHEFLFWSGLGVVLAALAWLAYQGGFLNLPLMLIAEIVALCFIGWSFLPQKKVAPPKLPPGKRAEIAKAVRASKAERRKKTPGK